MAIIPLGMKQLILMKIAEHDNTGPVSQSIDDLWDMYADKALQAPRLQYLYVLRDAYDIKIASLASDSYTLAGASSIRVNENTTEKSGSPSSALYKLRVETDNEIKKIENQYAMSRPPVVGTLSRTAPIMPGDGNSDDSVSSVQPDPNSRSLRGDPLYDYRIS